MAQQVDLRLMLATYFTGVLKTDEDKLKEAIQDPTKAVEELGGGKGAGGAGGADATGGTGGSSGDKKTASSSTEAYAIQYFAGKLQTDTQQSSAILKSMNDMLGQVINNIK